MVCFVYWCHNFYVYFPVLIVQSEKCNFPWRKTSRKECGKSKKKRKIDTNKGEKEEEYITLFNKKDKSKNKRKEIINNGKNCKLQD